MEDAKGLHEWLSVHIFFRGAPHSIYSGLGDRVVLDVVAPFIDVCRDRGWFERYFFVRYTEGGPHIRLRLRSRQETLEREVWPALTEYVARRSYDLQSEWVGHGGERVSQSNGLLHAHWVAYERELERYGGFDGVTLAEDIFHISSESAIRLLRGTAPEDRPTRLGRALLAMLVVIQTFCNERTEAARLCKHYATNFLHAIAGEQREMLLQLFGSGFERQSQVLTEYVDEAWQCLAAGEPVSNTLDAYASEMQTLCDRFRQLLEAGKLRRAGVVLPGWQAAVTSFVPNYVHMMNNRLGVAIPEEAYLSYLIYHTLMEMAQ